MYCKYTYYYLYTNGPNRNVNKKREADGSKSAFQHRDPGGLGGGSWGTWSSVPPTSTSSEGSAGW